MYKAVIFDLDGTLLDTIEDIAASVNCVLEEFGKAPRPIADFKYLVGEGANALLQKVFPQFDDAKIQEARNLFEKHYAIQYDKNTKIYEGIGKVLTFFQTRGYKMAVLSNKPNNFTKKCVYKYLSAWTFEAVYGIREDVPRKPDPAGAFEIAKELHVRPEECFFVGDTKIDMLTANSAQMCAIGVLWGFREKEELVEFGAQYICTVPQDIIKLISSLEDKK